MTADPVMLATAIQEVAESIMITDAQGVIQYVNPAFEKTTGFSRDETVGKTPSFLKSGEHPESFYEELWQTINSKNVWKGRIVNRRKGQGPVEQNVTISPALDPVGAIVNFISIASDVSKEALLEAQLRQAQKMEAIGQLASGIAHEINTPTQYIGDNVQFFKESFTDLAAVLEKYREFVAAFRGGDASETLADDIDALCKKVDLEFLLAEIPGAIDRSQEGNRRVAEVVRAMKEFAHPGAEEMVPTDVNHAIDTTIAVARNEWKYVADVETELDPDLPPVPCVPGPFNQVIVNLVVNAAHAIADVVGKGRKDKGIIKVTTRRNADCAEILISDTGPGIPNDIRDRVFDPFFTTKDVGKGTGQGLAIAHAVIVERHGGAITFESQEGEGTTFTIRLPLTQTEPEQS